MFYLFVLLAILLSISLVMSTVRSGRFRLWAKLFRLVAVVLAAGIFTLVFVRKSVDQFKKNSLTMQVVNKVAVPLDFYLIKVNRDTDHHNANYVARHIGVIRTNFYRVNYEDMKTSDEFWIAGLMGKSNLVYFSQHSVPNKNVDQIIEIRNYINQSMKLSDIAKAQIVDLKFRNMQEGIWITLDLLLLFLNVVLLMRKPNKKSQPVPGLVLKV